jgi:malate synthase
MLTSCPPLVCFVVHGEPQSWLRGVGCVPIHNLMEDAATAEISRSQVWQWVKHRAVTAEGRTVSAEWVKVLLDEECDKIR